ncbi:MAG: DUF1638 domain-containing protein [Chloroflexi bacterium]|nr:DUF1638 domain-containing protein [Chloroflexota bacterium]
MRYKLIACDVFARLAYYCAALSPNLIDIEFLEKGLHVEPANLRSELNAHINAVDPAVYDAILLAYGLCGNSVVGLRAGELPLVIPRAHDCITLFLGSAAQYAQEAREHPGTYWYTPDYIERGRAATDVVALGSSGIEDMQGVYAEYVEKYGQDNADYLMEVMGAWTAHYDRAVYIRTCEATFPDLSAVVRETAERRGWNYVEMAGSLLLIRDLIDGRWDDERYLVVQPGQAIEPSNDAGVVRSASD